MTEHDESEDPVIEYLRRGGIEYLRQLPEQIPPGRWLVHNTVRPARRLGDRGFRAWLADPDDKWEPCQCSWAAELGHHYRLRWSAADSRTIEEFDKFLSTVEPEDFQP